MSIISAMLTLLMIMDPMGNAVNYSLVLHNTPTERRTRIIFREFFIAWLILIATMFFGSPLLKALNISSDALNISGGVVLFLISLKLIFPDKEGLFADPETGGEPFIVPLATPFIAGPSSLAVVILFASTNPGELFSLGTAVTGAILATMTVVIIVNKCSRIFSKRIVSGMQRLTGMLLTTISIQLLLTALGNYLEKTNG